MILRIPSIPLLTRVPRRLAAILTVLTLAVGVPFGVVLASHNFSDVPTTHLFHHDIEVLVNTGVTAGCGGGRYCPEDPVTRGQMAAFMSRLGALDGQPPKVNATALDGFDSSNFLKTGTVTTSIGGSSWLAHFTSPTTVTRAVTRTFVSGDGNMVLGLVAPSQFSGVSYGLAALQICYSTGAGGFINTLSLFRTDAAAGGPLVFSDATDRTASGCYSVSPNVAAGEGLGVLAALGGGAAASVVLDSVKATWSSSGTFSFDALPDDASGLNAPN
jgi:hypothetical protein